MQLSLETFEHLEEDPPEPVDEAFLRPHLGDEEVEEGREISGLPQQKGVGFGGEGQDVTPLAGRIQKRGEQTESERKEGGGVDGEGEIYQKGRKIHSVV